MQIFKFGNCYLNFTERRVVKNKKYIELTPRTFDLLRLLVEKVGEIVTKDEILGSVWNGSFVEEGNLAVHVSKLRRQLEASKSEPFIETVQGSGYRFVSAVKTVPEDEWRKQLPAKPIKSNDKSSNNLVFDSIAVLPLDNESGDPEIEYLTDGLTEGFINSLSYISDLRVITRNTVFRYKNKKAEPKAVGETLGVAAVLTGRVRIIKDHLIIGVELTKVDDSRQIWGTQINQPLSDIVEVQEKIISAVTEKLKSQIESRNSASSAITQNPESYRLYLKGKYLTKHRTRENIYKAIECYQKSVFYDPTNVYSYVEIAEGYCNLFAFDLISYGEFSNKISQPLSAIAELNESLDVVQAIYGRKMYLDWRFAEAEKHLLNALQLNPNCLVAHYRYVVILTMSRRFSKALDELNQIKRVDPLSPATYLLMGKMFYRMERYENALGYLDDVIELEPENYESSAVLGAILTELGRYEEALAIFYKSLKLNFTFEVLAMIGYVSALKGNRTKAYEIIDQIKSQSNETREHPTLLSRIYLALDEKEIAYKYLEYALKQHETDLIALNSDPRWAKLRNEPNFKNLIKRIGIPT